MHYKAPDDSLHFIEPEFANLLPVGCVPITDAEAEVAVGALRPKVDPEPLRIAAHDYEYAQISGSAIGLLAMGVMQSKPKCLAVQAWIKSIWTEYYARKAGTSTDTDYSVVGSIPYTVPELMVELGL